LSGVSSQDHVSARPASRGLAVLGIAMALTTACGSSGTPAGSSTSRPGVVTTLPGNLTCKGGAPPNDASPDFYRQQYAELVNPLKERLKTYDAAAESGDARSIGLAAAALDTDIRADAGLVNIPRLYGCYDQKVLARLQNATEAFATTLDALSCASDNRCNRKQTEVPGLVAQASPQERATIGAFNAYAAQLGGEELSSPQASTVPKSRRM
jgi:hypothetical protein